MKQIYKKILIANFIILILLAQTVVSIIYPDNGMHAQTNQVCDENLEAADDAYYDGEYSESFRLIKLCLEKPNITNEQRSLAFSILARTFVAMDKPEKATEYISKILDLNPDYLPTIEEETPKYVNLVTLIKNEKEQQKQIEVDSGISSWVWIGAGSVVATAAIIVMTSSGNGDDKPKEATLPEPPEFP